MRIAPDYELLQEFAKIIVSLVPKFPDLKQWSPKELMKSWGKLSKYLHWCGSRNNTTESVNWRANAGGEVRSVIEPIWIKITSGQSGIMHPKDMHPEILELWRQYKNGSVDAEGIRIRMQILKPALEAKYA